MMTLLRCKEAFSREFDGVTVIVQAGDIVRDSDPVVKGSESRFEKVEDAVKSFARPQPKRADPVVEQATAAPGEKRAGPGHPADDPDPATVRAWAKDNGIDVPSRGKIPADVLEQYKAAQEDGH